MKKEEWEEEVPGGFLTDDSESAQLALPAYLRMQKNQ